jgi:hypothetical protein
MSPLATGLISSAVINRYPPRKMKYETYDKGLTIITLLFFWGVYFLIK